MNQQIDNELGGHVSEDVRVAIECARKIRQAHELLAAFMVGAYRSEQIHEA